eukprot:CAMPEP_0204037446 /NCGR_PEP_ID=MMETSP0360-20130528/83333_1 /ASSEMBLY_ACC=CAM_ASM_000342 /TAXON_ID=268821 /ORGANISM="Scrippsiella Hangoei, Strain SHTV-5" /LENGTH=80 /DNA_ID=CAMNT_0050982861 /DNA_START=148 /DNA_END=387 /DNA_ORIENTATION=-
MRPNIGTATEPIDERSSVSLHHVPGVQTHSGNTSTLYFPKVLFPVGSSQSVGSSPPTLPKRQYVIFVSALLYFRKAVRFG